MEDNQQVQISSEEFKSWTEQEVTKLVVRELLSIRDQAKDYLASGATLAKDNDISTDRMVGRLEGLTELFNLFREVKEDSKGKENYAH